jgi:hypothetical protein
MGVGRSSVLVGSALTVILFSFPRASAAGTEILPQSPEFQVNTYTPFGQVRPSIAADGAGNFVVVWHQTDSGGTPLEVIGRRFTSAGAPASGEFQANAYTPGNQLRPAVARNASGAFVVVWISDGQDGDGYGVFGRRYDAAGNPLAGEFQVNAYTAGVQDRPAVAMGAGGDFVVSWESPDSDSSGIFARRFNAGGTAVGAELQVNNYVTDTQLFSQVFRKGDGSFIVSWISNTEDGDGYGAFGRRFDSGGSPLTPEFQLNAYTTGDQGFASIAYAPDEGFGAAWQSEGQDGSGFGIFATGFDDFGVRDSDDGEIQINDRTVNIQAFPTALIVGSHNFVVVWQSLGGDGSDYGIFARALDFNDLIGDEVQLNTYTPLSQLGPRAVTTGQRFVVVWNSVAQDGAGTGIFGRRFVVPLTLDVDGSGDIQPLTDGLLVLRYEFGFRGSTLITAAVAANCSRCDAPSIEAYLGSV